MVDYCKPTIPHYNSMELLFLVFLHDYGSIMTAETE